ncbi:MAG: sulfite exporter TauE/SafE family protein [Sulfurovum sp.]|nr:MAG: sulfite exporter TauE/SafE family protein [Sulfurovum sp.]
MLFFAIFITGLQLGATACALSCLPIMTPILLGGIEDKNRALSVLWRYFSGKILAYIVISMVAFFSIDLFKERFSKDISFSKVGAIFIILLAILMLYHTLYKNDSCKSSCNTSLKYGYFGVGFFSSFSFCLPVGTLIATSSLSSSLFYSFMYGLSFGLGVVIVPFLFFYFFIFQITSNILLELKSHKKHIEIFSALLLMVIGIFIFLDYFKL